MSVEPYRLLVVANRTCPCPGLPGVILEHVREHAEDRPAEVHVVAPALTSKLRWALSDVDGALSAAEERLGIALMLLRDAGLPTTGEVGDANPMQAIEDALPAFAAHGVLISTWPQGRSNWLERDLVGRARRRLDVDVHHVVSRFDAPVQVAA
ncbi:hypothetical protein [Patulibacter minatonensis]|uniref:hypothetical protein n=1 Tax=Patulibacter minatonensis TaxID=298163 RepID=UPI00047BBB26|nr:hypothetical protein [Patulibacter minatonensis]